MIIMDALRLTHTHTHILDIMDEITTRRYTDLSTLFSKDYSDANEINFPEKSYVQKVW